MKVRVSAVVKMTPEGTEHYFLPPRDGLRSPQKERPGTEHTIMEEEGAGTCFWGRRNKGFCFYKHQEGSNGKVYWLHKYVRLDPNDFFGGPPVCQTVYIMESDVDGTALRVFAKTDMDVSLVSSSSTRIIANESGVFVIYEGSNEKNVSGRFIVWYGTDGKLIRKAFLEDYTCDPYLCGYLLFYTITEKVSQEGSGNRSAYLLNLETMEKKCLVKAEYVNLGRGREKYIDAEQVIGNEYGAVIKICYFVNMTANTPERRMIYSDTSCWYYVNFSTGKTMCLSGGALSPMLAYYKADQYLAKSRSLEREEQ